MEQQKTAIEIDCLTLAHDAITARTKKSYVPPRIEDLGIQATKTGLLPGDDGVGTSTGS
jgi:hypothetical protein